MSRHDSLLFAGATLVFMLAPFIGEFILITYRFYRDRREQQRVFRALDRRVNL